MKFEIVQKINIFIHYFPNFYMIHNRNNSSFKHFNNSSHYKELLILLCIENN